MNARPAEAARALPASVKETCAQLQTLRLHAIDLVTWAGNSSGDPLDRGRRRFLGGHPAGALQCFLQLLEKPSDLVMECNARARTAYGHVAMVSDQGQGLTSFYVLGGIMVAAW